MSLHCCDSSCSLPEGDAARLRSPSGPVDRDNDNLEAPDRFSEHLGRLREGCDAAGRHAVAQSERHRIETGRGRPPRERVVQDIEVPLERCAEFLDWFLGTVPIAPIWLCPLRLRDPAGWPLYPIRPGHTYVNVGFWSSVPIGPEPGYTNRRIEEKVSELDGHKSLYSDSFYSRRESDELYGGRVYDTAKTTFDPDTRFLDLYSKAVQRR